MRFEVVHGYKWSQIIDMAQQQKVDVLPAVGRTEQREEYLLFTRNYISVPGVLVSAQSHESIEKLRGRKVAVVRDYMWDNLISNANLDKTLESFTEAEIIAIRSNWIKFNKPAFWRDQNFWYSMLAALGIVLTLFSGFIIWNHMLRKEVEARTSELQTAQKKLMQAEKMESIGRLAAGVAHEVKNPLTIIQMGIDYLSQEIPEDEVSIAVIKDIDDAVRRADAVIYGLLNFSRDKKLELKLGSLNDVITSALHLVDHELRLRNISCQSFLAEG